MREAGDLGTTTRAARDTVTIISDPQTPGHVIDTGRGGGRGECVTLCVNNNNKDCKGHCGLERDHNQRPQTPGPRATAGAPIVIGPQPRIRLTRFR